MMKKTTTTTAMTNTTMTAKLTFAMIYLSRYGRAFFLFYYDEDDDDHCDSDDHLAMNFENFIRAIFFLFFIHIIHSSFFPRFYLYLLHLQVIRVLAPCSCSCYSNFAVTLNAEMYPELLKYNRFVCILGIDIVNDLFL